MSQSVGIATSLRYFTISLTLLCTSLVPACVSRKIQVPRLLTPIQDATLGELRDRLNATQNLMSLSGRMDIQFQSEVEAKRGEGELYTTAVGRLVLARPHKVYVLIQLPIVRTNFAECASDGDRFQLIVYPEKYRVMLLGTNNKRYERPTPETALDERVRMAGALKNLRPQHFTEALMFDAINSDQESTVVREEVRQVEDDLRENAPRGSRVIRSYYVVSAMRNLAREGWQLSSKYWFDRNHALRLVRRQIFEDQGHLVEDIGYTDYWRENPVNLELPAIISILRPYDQYSVRIVLSQSSVVVNHEIPPNTFVLEKPEDWPESTQVIDLDRRPK